MPTTPPVQSRIDNTFAGLIGLRFSKSANGSSICSLEVKQNLLNPHGVLHGGVAYSLADTGMGAALYSLLEEGQSCATVEIKIAYLRPVTSGTLACETKVIHKGRKLAFLESEVKSGEQLIAKAMGTYSIFNIKGTKK